MRLGRKLAIALLAAAVVVAAVYATDAFTTTTVSRSADVRVAGDGSAFLALQPSEGPNGEYSSYGPNGALQVTMDGAGSGGATGVNPDSQTVFKNVFTITNKGSQSVSVWLTGGNPAVTFIGPDGRPIEDRSGAVTLTPGGRSLHVGLVIDARGVEPGADLLESVTIHTDASVAGDSVSVPTDGMGGGSRSRGEPARERTVGEQIPMSSSGESSGPVLSVDTVITELRERGAEIRTWVREHPVATRTIIAVASSLLFGIPSSGDSGESPSSEEQIPGVGSDVTCDQITTLLEKSNMTCSEFLTGTGTTGTNQLPDDVELHPVNCSEWGRVIETTNMSCSDLSNRNRNISIFDTSPPYTEKQWRKLLRRHNQTYVVDTYCPPPPGISFTSDPHAPDYHSCRRSVDAARLTNEEAFNLGVNRGETGMPGGVFYTEASSSPYYLIGWMAGGLVPGIDIAADGRDFLQNFASGDYGEAALDGAAIFPVVGKPADVGQIVKYSNNWVSEFPKKTDDAVQPIAKHVLPQLTDKKDALRVLDVFTHDKASKLHKTGVPVDKIIRYAQNGKFTQVAKAKLSGGIDLGPTSIITRTDSTTVIKGGKYGTDVELRVPDNGKKFYVKNSEDIDSAKQLRDMSPQRIGAVVEDNIAPKLVKQRKGYDLVYGAQKGGTDPGIDMITKNAKGQYVVTEVKFTTKSGNLGKGMMNSKRKVKNPVTGEQDEVKQMSDQWIEDSFEKEITKGEMANYEEAQKAIETGNYKKEVIVVQDGVSKKSITKGLAETVDDVTIVRTGGVTKSKNK